MISTDEQLNADIETASEGYAARFSGSIGEWMLKKQSDIVLDLLKQYPGTKILDVGGGHAQLARPLADEGFDITVHGSDDICSVRIKDLLDADKCSFVCSSMFEIPLAGASVETVLCFRLITHCSEWEKLIAELCRIAGKRIIIDYPTSKSLNAIISGSLFSFKKKLEGNTRSWRLFSRQELETVFRQHGFSCKTERKQFFLPMVLHRTLKCVAVSSFLETVCRKLGLTGLWGSPVIMLLEREQ
jgi:2-polyprenyl-3-methyl-5-hydroxy-6-metoxy-1,4-benzoquinol methylase